MDRGPDRSGRDLPAPYRNPWSLLARDLRAVGASLRLKAQEIWRRNAEGDLAMPGLWPRRLAAWFWPLVLLLLMCATVLVLRIARPGGSIEPLVQPLPAPQTAAAAESEADAGPSDSRRSGLNNPSDLINPSGPTNPDAEQTTEQTTGQTAEQSAQPLISPPAALKIDPLLALLADLDPQGLIVTAKPWPAAGRLELALNEGFTSLSGEQRRQRAELWLERSMDLGYDRLELGDPEGRSLGRTALVGQGMIMLETPETTESDAAR
ncbi:hypothetical protein KQ302_05745 [Synechococcus sp. CS-602]|uniref:hypothetical protein n=1 Tax=Synechococcaceae TaxID=1890426 RepID=UPI000AD8AFD4|nr:MULTISPECIES: hypothetical protein [Synechococcaceae]MCT4364192.1 hypothetical protein [Candidatus Regnicoccus frigidus MAG-AL1]MCT0201118.1 hypothetical protein [Synechococcus sp. CS-603]MCT0204611.1 hypothetical protein [Synechococcus sp. CS-602]MCT0245909.1 hypothetical protein [Synechococcus sp. CS-601]MCT4366627.1 hypothetical protein [Candidatus Regnicoccus frigidus MAG-AL2]